MTTDPVVTFFTALLLDPRAIDQTASSVRPEDFPEEEHRHTFSAMLELAQGGKPIDVAHVFDRLLERGYSATRASELLARLMDGQPAVADIRHYIALFQKRFRKRRLLHMAETALARAQSGADADEVLGQLQDELCAMQSACPESRPVAARDFVPAFLNQAMVEREHDSDLAGISTGVPVLDDMTTGIRPGEFWVGGALPGRGKSAWGLQVAVGAVSRGLPVLVFSLEMTGDELSRRILAHQFGSWSMRTLRDISQGTWREILSKAADVATLPLYVDAAADLTPSQLSARGRTAVRERGIKLIVVDYLQLLRGPEREIRERVGNAANVLRQLAKDTQVPVLALSQLRRPANLNDAPSMLHLKESGDIEAHAHTVLLLYQPLGEDARPTGQDEIIIGKQRSGPLGTVPVVFDTRTLIFKPRSFATGRDTGPRSWMDERD
jgi:replicative DNA helicase